MKLAETDYIVTAYAESAAGPGWANQPVWVVVRSQLDGSVRIECLQPNEQSGEIQGLYAVSQAAHGSMTRAVRTMLYWQGESRRQRLERRMA